MNRDCVLRGRSFRQGMIDLLREIGNWESGTSAMAIGTVLLFCEVLILVLVKLSQIVWSAAFFGKLLENSCSLRPSAGPSFLSSSHGRARVALGMQCTSLPNVSFSHGENIV